MASFGDRLAEAILSKQTRVCVGIDPRPEMLPAEFRRRVGRDIGATCEALLDFHRAVFEIVAAHAACVKLNAAYFERLGPYGAPAMFATIHSAHQFGLPVIADVKRGDIGESAEAYAQAWLESYPADAVTVNPYLGTDGVRPFVEIAAGDGKGVFVLVRTSNDSASEVQDVRDAEGRPLYLRIARLVRAWGADTEGEHGYGTVGAVVSARDPEVLAQVRAALPRAFLLVPGYGAQGGTPPMLRPAFEADGLGVVVNASRSVVYAWADAALRARFGEANWEKATEAAVVEMKRAINEVAG